MKKNLISSLILTFSVALIFACKSKPEKKMVFESKQDYENTMIESHKFFLKKEKEKIKQYIDSSGLKFEQTGTGLRYSILNHANGDSLNKGDIAVLSYTLCLIEGDTLYETKAGEYQEFIVDFDNVERGLHEGVKKMSVGDEAVFILPAHLAHGVTGDQAAIPNQATLVYKLKLHSKK